MMTPCVKFCVRRDVLIGITSLMVLVLLSYMYISRRVADLDVKYRRLESGNSNVSRDISQTTNQSKDYKTPILTLFTTFRDRKTRIETHHRTLTNWASLRPFVQPILMTPITDRNSTWPETARRKGWKVKECTGLRHNIPILKSMFLDVMQESESPFIGFANGDILFDSAIHINLQRLYEEQKMTNNNESILLVGRRTNIQLMTFNLGKGDDYTLLHDAFKKTKQLLVSVVAQDYFIVNRNGLPWNKIPDFVVGRPGYDNWLVTMAQKWNIQLVDLSNTVMALHQTGQDGIGAGFKIAPKQRGLNYQLAKRFKYAAGKTTCADKILTCNNANVPSTQCPFTDLAVAMMKDRPRYCLSKPNQALFYICVVLFALCLIFVIIIHHLKCTFTSIISKCIMYMYKPPVSNEKI